MAKIGLTMMNSRVRICCGTDIVELIRGMRTMQGCEKQ